MSTKPTKKSKTIKKKRASDAEPMTVSQHSTGPLLSRARLRDRVDRLAAEHGTEPTAPVRKVLEHDLLADIYHSGRPQPLGTTLYPAVSVKDGAANELVPHPTKQGRSYELVYSKSYFLKLESHSTPEGECEHELWVDDHGVFNVEPDPGDGYPMKTGRATCINSVPRKRDDGTWGSTETWQVPCPHGDWDMVTEWEPEPTRYTVDSKKQDLEPKNMALTEARPIGRHDLTKFAQTGNYRNLSESHNAWYKRTLFHGRATSLSLQGQEFDFLTGGCLTNALTWAASQE